jgi:hypothetical protein
MPSLRPFLAVALALATASSAAAQSNADRTRALQGAWRFVETSNPRTFQVVTNQPGMRLFVDGHYSNLQVNGLRARTQVDSTSSSLQMWNTWGTGFTAQAGTFEVRGDTVITRPLVAKNPNVMTPEVFNRYLYRQTGDELWLTPTASQAGPAANPATAYYQRVRAPGAPTN